MLRATVSAAAILCAAQSANAQDLSSTTGGTSSTLPERGIDDNRLVGVASRERPGLDPVGIRMGSMFLYPSVDSELEFDSNIFASATDEEDDFNYIVTPRLALQSDWGRHELNASVQARNEFFFDNGTEDKTNITSAVNLRLDVTATSALFVDGFYDDLVEDRTSNAFDITTQEPIDFTRAGGGVQFVNRFNRVTLSLGGSYLDLDFDDAVFQGSGLESDQDIRDREVMTADLRLDYQISPETSLFVRGVYNERDFGQELADGAPSDRDSDGFELLGGASFTLGSLLTGEVSLGYIEQSFDDDPNLDDLSAFNYFAALQWFPSERTTVTVNGGSVAEDATLPGSSAFLSRSGSIRIDQEIREDFIVNVNALYNNDDFEGITRTDDRFTIGGGGTYFINRYIRAFGRVAYTEQDSTDDFFDFDRFEAVIGFTLSL